jgi:hypothetical protein
MSTLKLVAWAIAIVGLAATICIAAAYWLLASEIGRDVTRLVAEAQRPGPVIREDMIAGLPEPAQRYLNHAGVVGTAIPRLVRLSQSGRIRSSADASWLTFVADETYSTSPPSFVWRAYFPSPFAPLVMGRDKYLGGEGSILMKMLALLPVADEHGEELRAAGLMRYLNEMMWFPAAYLGSNVKITPRDDSSFDVVIADRGMTAAATIFIDAEGKVTNFRAHRYNTGSRSVELWETPIVAYGRYDGKMLPRSGSAIWKLPAGDLTYIELEVTAVTYED